MTTSPARIEANRRNAQKSTGPKTEEGKAVSRLNATRHGLAASPDLVGPFDDAGLVRERAAAFAEEWRATGEGGRLLARRAALLSVRMERLAERDENATRERMAQAVEEARAPHRQILNRLIAELAPGRPQRSLALRHLWASPDGVDHLLGFAKDLVADLNLGAEPADRARHRAAAWLDPEATFEPESASGPLDDEALLGRIAAEVDRWEARADELAPEREHLAAEHRRIALDAAFDPAPEAHQARRYEAAAERGFYRALQAIRRSARTAPAEPTLAEPEPMAVSTTESAPLPDSTAPTLSAEEPRAAEPVADTTGPSLGSFGAGGTSARFGLVEAAPMTHPRPPVGAPERRRGRPDPLRLVASAR